MVSQAAVSITLIDLPRKFTLMGLDQPEKVRGDTGRFAWSGNSSRPKLLLVMLKPGPLSALSSVQLFYNQKQASSTTPTVHTHTRAHTRASLCQ